jgi:Fis family transcriptional regulator
MVDRGILYDDALHEFERRFISRALSHADGSLSRAAALLGIHRNTLTRKVLEYKIKRKTG